MTPNEPRPGQTFESPGVNVTPTPAGYCQFFDEIGCHAYMGGESSVHPGHEYTGTTCCGVDPEPGEVEQQ